MANENPATRIEQLVKDCYSYVNLRYASIRLSLVEGLSSLFGSIIAILIFSLLALLALMLFSFVLVLVVGEWVNSLLWGAVIVGGFYLVLAFIVLLLRKRIMADSMVRMCTKMFFPLKEHGDE